MTIILYFIFAEKLESTIRNEVYFYIVLVCYSLENLIGYLFAIWLMIHYLMYNYRN